jgi:hypothetical protein
VRGIGHEIRDGGAEKAVVPVKGRRGVSILESCRRKKGKEWKPINADKEVRQISHALPVKSVKGDPGGVEIHSVVPETEEITVFLEMVINGQGEWQASFF